MRSALLRILPIALFLLSLIIGAPHAQLMLTGVGGGGTGGGVYSPQGVAFSSTAWATKGSALTGSSNGKSGLVSVWFNNTNATGALHYLFYVGDNTTQEYFALRLSSSTGASICEGANTSFTTILSIRSVTSFSSMGTTWKNFICSWNLATGRGQVYTNDVSDIASSPTLTNDTINYTGPNPIIGSTQGGSTTTTYGSNTAELQVWFNVDIDLSVTANRRNFIDGSGNAVNPSVAAANIGTTQLVLLSGTASSWITNQGSGGGFTIQAGTITAASSNPP